MIKKTVSNLTSKIKALKEVLPTPSEGFVNQGDDRTDTYKDERSVVEQLRRIVVQETEGYYSAVPSDLRETYEHSGKNGVTCNCVSGSSILLPILFLLVSGKLLWAWNAVIDMFTGKDDEDDHRQKARSSKDYILPILLLAFCVKYDTIAGSRGSNCSCRD